MTTTDAIMRQAPVIPVLVIDDAAKAVPLAEALVAGGLHVLEVTLRTPAALDVIREMSRVDGALVGAGTVTNPAQFDQVLEAGAKFVVSPGLTEPLAKVAQSTRTPFLPGIATATEIMQGLDLGFDRFKFFPAEAAGGVPALKALTGPFGQVKFCPTGGVTTGNLGAWLSIPQVLCACGTWMVSKDSTDMAAVTKAARDAVALAEQAGWRAS